MTALALFAAALLGAAPSKPAATVVDDFLQLPDGAFGEWKATAPERKKAIQVTDLKNGFLSGAYEKEGAGGAFEAALFVKKDGGHLLGLKNSPYDMGCPTGSIRFYAPQGKQWVDVTSEVWPEVDEAAVAKRVRQKVKEDVLDQCGSAASSLEWSLPREGTTVTGVAAWTSEIKVEVAWNRAEGRFEVKDPALRAKAAPKH